MSIFSRKPSDPDPTSVDVPSLRPSLSAPVGFETVFGANCTLEGTLTSAGNVRMDGTFSGTLAISGNILVGETAKITANIDARNISIAGAVRGNVTGNKVQILRTGRVWGDIHASALTMEEGAFIDGKITMQGHQASVTTTTSGDVVSTHAPTEAAEKAADEDDGAAEAQDSDSSADADGGGGDGGGE